MVFYFVIHFNILLMPEHFPKHEDIDDKEPKNTDPEAYLFAR